MKRRVSAVILLGLAVAIVAWVFAFRGQAWAAPITNPFFVPGSLLVLALTHADPHPQNLAVILIGYAVDFIVTWAVMATLVGLVMRLILKGRATA